MEFLKQVWQQSLERQPAPEWWIPSLAILAALPLIWPRRVWPVTRNAVTIAHEGGHALIAFLAGRRLSGVTLHSDTSGVTVSSGSPTGLGMVATAYAGYVAPSLLGVGGAAAIAHGWVNAMLWGTATLLAVMFLLIRNFYGALVVSVAGLLVFAVSWWTPAWTQTLFASLLVWFMLLSGPRPVWELHRLRRDGRAEDSDADQLAALTGIPGIVWIFSFVLVCAACLGFAIRWTFLA
jgi:hypothetical protein